VAALVTGCEEGGCAGTFWASRVAPRVAGIVLEGAACCGDAMALAAKNPVTACINIAAMKTCPLVIGHRPDLRMRPGLRRPG
jgi:hypothetical protein